MYYKIKEFFCQVGYLIKFYWNAQSAKHKKWRNALWWITYLSNFAFSWECSRASSFIGDLHSNITVVFLPPHITSVIQAMYRVIANFYCLLPEEDIRPGKFCNWGRHWQGTDAILEGLQHLWQRQQHCFCLGWCHQAAVRKRRKTPKIIHSDGFSSSFGILHQAP